MVTAFVYLVRKLSTYLKKELNKQYNTAQLELSESKGLATINMKLVAKLERAYLKDDAP
jgi:hypothetical protein